MHELEAVRKIVLLEVIAARDEFRRGQAELRVLAAARGPFARSARVQTHAETDERLDVHLAGNFHDLPQFLDLLDDQDNLLAKLAAQERVLDEDGVLVAVANDDAFRVTVDRQRSEEFRLAAAFQAEMKIVASVEDFLHHLTQLVDLDREYAAVRLLVARLGDGTGKRLADRLHAVPQKVLEPDDEREPETLFARLVDDRHHVNGRALIHQRRDLRVPLGVDREITRTPTVDVVSGSGGWDVPVDTRFNH